MKFRTLSVSRSEHVVLAVRGDDATHRRVDHLDVRCDRGPEAMATASTMPRRTDRGRGRIVAVASSRTASRPWWRRTPRPAASNRSREPARARSCIDHVRRPARGVLDALLLPENVDTLRKIVTYHVIRRPRCPQPMYGR